jgi:hypothetical protein
MSQVCRDADMPVTQTMKATGSNGGSSITLRRGLLCRLGGLPTASVENLTSEAVAHLSHNLVEKMRGLQEMRESLSTLLFEKIGKTHDSPKRNALTQLRRDIYNLRAPKESGIRAACERPDDLLGHRVLTFAQALEQYGTQLSLFAATYETETVRTRRSLQQSWQ